MASVTRINGTQSTVATLYNPNCNLYLITVKIANGTPVDLQLQDGADSDGAGADAGGADQIVEMIIKEISPLAYFVPAAGNGVIYVVMDKSISDATELRTRIRNLSPINTVVVTGTTVTAATSFTVA